MALSDFANGTWLNPPAEHEVSSGRLTLVTAPSTDFWRHTHYGFVRDSGHLQEEEAERAISGLNGSSLDGRMIRVDRATPRGAGGPPRPRPAGGGFAPRSGGGGGFAPRPGGGSGRAAPEE